MIWEKPSEKFLTDLPPEHESTPYPVVDDELPSLYPCAAFCGAVGSGKTSQACRLVLQYLQLGARDAITGKPVKQRCILFSPSIDSNPVWNALPKEDLLKIDGYSDARMRELWNDMKTEKLARDKYIAESELFERLRQSKKGLEDLAPDMQAWLEKHDYKRPKPECQYPQGVVYHLILDDCLGQACFKSQGASVFTSFCLARRHAQTCIYICTQSLKQIPRRLRQSISLWVLFKYASHNVLSHDFYPEVSNLLTEREFSKLYEHSVRDRHDFLVVDLTAPSDRAFRKGWTRFLSLE